MFDSEDFESLFNEDWRDPTDGGERAAIYVLMAFGLLAGVLGAGYSIATLFRPALWGSTNASPVSLRILSWVLLALTLAVGVGCAAFFASEKKHFHLFPVTAEKVVTAGFTLVVAFGFLGFQMIGGGSPGIHDNPLPAAGFMWLAAGGLYVVSLAVGLICAYWPRLTNRKQRLNAFVDRRFGIDDKQNWLEDPAAPGDFNLIPVVFLRLSDGEMLKLKCSDTTYDRATPGSFGRAVVQGKRLVEFKRIR